MSNIPRYIPDTLLNDYTLNGQIEIIDMFYSDGTEPKNIVWTDEFVENFKNTMTPYNIFNNIDISDTSNRYRCAYHNGPLFNLIAIINYKSHIENKKVAVIGSLDPWLEALILNFNPLSVTTIEYNTPQTTKLIKTVSYNDFINSDEQYDAIFSYSSIEHSGLGRYGDPLNPNGDIETMQQIHKHLKDYGLAFIGIPIGKDLVCWNAHRIYGNIRLPLVFKGFKELEWIGSPKSYIDFGVTHIGGGTQPVIVLEKL
jgi:hypothetical protein